MKRSRTLLRYSALFFSVMWFAGCATPTSPLDVDYRSGHRQNRADSEIAILQTPPNMVEQSVSWNQIGKSGEVTLSELERAKQKSASKHQQSDIETPQQEYGMAIHREGNESWLSVKSQNTAQLWSNIRQFLLLQGFILVVDNRQQGILETDWRETRPDVDQGFVRDIIVKGLGNSYVSAVRNKYRIRVQSLGSQDTDIFISQVGMFSQVEGTFKDESKWVMAPSNPTLESEYLRLLMQYLIKANEASETKSITLPNDARSDQEVTQDNVQAIAKSASVSVSQAQAQTQAQVEKSQSHQASEPVALTAENVEEQLANIPGDVYLMQNYDNAWLITGIALTRANFTVDHADKDKGIYTIRYVDPYDLRAAKQGFWSQLLHGKIQTKAQLYRINVKALKPNETRVAIVNEDGDVDQSLPAKQIMNLLIPNL